MRTTILCAAVVTLGLVVSGATVSAHHAFSSEFDANRHVVFTGTVSKMMRVNPHAWIYVDVKKADGTTEEWMVEAGTPNTLLRRGFTKDSLRNGTEVIIEGYQAKNGAKRLNGRDVMLPDGKRMFLGSSGTGAPNDGRDPGGDK